MHKSDLLLKIIRRLPVAIKRKSTHLYVICSLPISLTSSLFILLIKLKPHKSPLVHNCALCALSQTLRCDTCCFLPEKLLTDLIRTTCHRSASLQCPLLREASLSPCEAFASLCSVTLHAVHFLPDTSQHLSLPFIFVHQLSSSLGCKVHYITSMRSHS